MNIAAGMESDDSSSDCDIVYTSNITDKKSNSVEKKADDIEHTPVVRNVANGFVQASSPAENERKHKLFSHSHRSSVRNSHQQRRQYVDPKSSQLLDDLRYAVMQGNLDVVKSIISKGIWIDSILKAGWTGLMYACSSGCFEVVEYLLENNADPNYHRDLFTPLMAACAAGKNEESLLKCVNLLLQHGAQVNAHERHLTTPLMFAAREGQLGICKRLVEHGANLDEQDNRGRTALSWAASSGFGQIVRLLIEKGADTQKMDTMGQMPLDMAYAQGYKEIGALLEKSSLVREQATGKDDGSHEGPPSQMSKEIMRFSRAASAGTDSKKIIKHGELELFLTGLGQSELIETFQHHQLSFYDLLIMNEDDLEQIGISKVGVRKKILEALKAVHKKEWETSSLPNLKQCQSISCSDAVAMMANIAKHVKYISCSVIYIRQQIQHRPRILELAQDSANVHDLIDELGDSLKNIHFLKDELRFLKLHLDKVQDNVNYIPADLIVETVTDTKHRTMHVFLGVAILSLTVGGVLWKHPNFFSNVQSLIPNRVPFLTWK